MALAVKNPPEAAPESPFARLAVSSVAGLLFLLGSIAVVFWGIPWAWGQVPMLINAFVSNTLMIVLMIAAAVGLGVLGSRLGGAEMPHGLKAGIFIAGAGLLTCLLVAWTVGIIFEAILSRWEGLWAIGAVIAAASGLGLLYLFARWFFRPSAEEWFTAVEDQGWFSATAYKKSQGLRVRRGTLLGILIMAACGIWTLWSHNALVYGLPNPAAGVPNTNFWYLRIPFSEKIVPFLADVRFTVPLLLSALSLWLAWRVVNWPAFADFLIATEAELNKVSWTTRKRLFQDTIVVLVTVVLFTVFLFMVDMLWGVLLSKGLGVLKSDTTTNQQRDGTREQPW
jgi:preprotein translocase SecE subunit